MTGPGEGGFWFLLTTNRQATKIPFSVDRGSLTNLPRRATRLGDAQGILSVLRSVMSCESAPTPRRTNADYAETKNDSERETRESAGVSEDDLTVCGF